MSGAERSDPLLGEPLEIEVSTLEPTPDQVQAFVGPQADYYLERWHRLRLGSSALGFNWAAFFLTLTWLLYRRMYRFFWVGVAVWVGAVVLVTVAVVISVLAKLPILILLTMGGLSFAVSIGVPVTYGRYGTYWYYLHLQRQLSQLTPAGQADLAAVSRMGGTNLWGAVVFGVILSAISIWAKSGRP
jgi:hypothetical protein